MRLALALLTAVFWWGIAANAGADIDPASDVLVFDDVFYPYDPEVCSELKRGLARFTADARDAGYPVKVALIDSESDLGGAPQLFGKPQEYAVFLQSEIARQIDGPVLVVMPGGFGLAPRQPEAAVLDKIKVPDDADSNRLARAALDAIQRLAKDAGQSLKKPKIGPGCSTEGGSSSLMFILPVALLLIAGAAIAIGRRGGSHEEGKRP
jgi:hypothetical protein